MSLRWRWSLLGVLVAVVISGLMPNALLSKAETGIITSANTTISWSQVESPFFGSGCADASCGKGVPSPAAPTLTVVAAATLSGILALVALRRRTLFEYVASGVLPRGNFQGFFHPPQFS
jgi:hypothetical protein